ncbi:MAG TPA: Ig domain-containing protein, partial [Victivallales bacterium]|nr:Ig domain-containing protein [Victivallales bacterium]
MQTKINLAAVEQWNEGAPRINGPEIYGASAKKTFLYTVPATGERPIRFSAQALPDGLRIDASNGQITGSVAQDGEYRILLQAENRHGRAEKEFCIAIGKG